MILRDRLLRFGIILNPIVVFEATEVSNEFSGITLFVLLDHWTDSIKVFSVTFNASRRTFKGPSCQPCTWIFNHSRPILQKVTPDGCLVCSGVDRFQIARLLHIWQFVARQQVMHLTVWEGQSLPSFCQCLRWCLVQHHLHQAVSQWDLQSACQCTVPYPWLTCGCFSDYWCPPGFSPALCSSLMVIPFPPCCPIVQN